MQEFSFPILGAPTSSWLWLVITIGLVAAWVFFTRRDWRSLRALRAQWQAIAIGKQRAIQGNSDQPSAEDALGFQPVANAVAGLLGNHATQPPYSVVLSGGWGSGKTSVMRQIEKQLTDEQTPPFRAVWVNVWHFQSGQHLLVAFLRRLLYGAGLHRQMKPWKQLGFWETFFLVFTLSLLSPVVLYLAAVLVDVLLPYLSLHPVFAARLEEYGRAPFQLLGQLPRLVEAFGQHGPADAKDDVTSPGLLFWGTLLTWVVSALGFLRKLREDGNPLTELVPAEKFEMAARADAGFRERYQEEFHRVMTGAPPGTRLVVFIDDVDRIPGSRVLELLESINFIADTAASAARAAAPAENAPPTGVYFVLGMYVPEVVRTLATALDSDRWLPTDAVRHEHAANYLEKLIDLVVPMPNLKLCDEAQLQNLIFNRKPQPANA